MADPRPPFYAKRPDQKPPVQKPSPASPTAQPANTIKRTLKSAPPTK